MPTAQELFDIAREQARLEAESLTMLATSLDKSLNDALDVIVACKGKVLVTGAGTSAAIARRLAHLMSCCGTPAMFIDSGDSLHGGAGAITADDVVYFISKGGSSQEVNALARIAQARGAKLVAQTEAPDAPLAQQCDAVFLVDASKAPDPYGMIALGSSLMASLAGDALCRALLDANGYTLESFGLTHPGGAVGRKLEEDSAS